MKPTRSANRTETSRRSATAAELATGACAAGRAVGSSGVAHSEQNFAPGRFALPQVGQDAGRGVAHSAQNLEPGRFSVPQFEQVTTLTASLCGPFTLRVVHEHTRPHADVRAADRPKAYAA